MNVYEVRYRANSSVEIEAIVVGNTSDEVIEYCFTNCDSEIPRDEFYVKEVYSTEKDDPSMVKRIYYNATEQY